MGSRSIDVGPVNVKGPVRARYARVVWKDGTLYVVSKNGSRLVRQTLSTSEPKPPKVHDGYWRAKTDDGQSVTFSRKGCSG